MGAIAIKTSGLTKSFGRTLAVDHLDLEVVKGELFGLVGPDGAGKSTTMRLLTGHHEADVGQCPGRRPSHPRRGRADQGAHRLHVAEVRPL